MAGHYCDRLSTTVVSFGAFDLLRYVDRSGNDVRANKRSVGSRHAPCIITIDAISCRAGAAASAGIRGAHEHDVAEAWPSVPASAQLDDDVEFRCSSEQGSRELESLTRSC